LRAELDSELFVVLMRRSPGRSRCRLATAEPGIGIRNANAEMVGGCASVEGDQPRLVMRDLDV